MAQTDHNDFVPAIADIACEAGALLIIESGRTVVETGAAI